MFPTASLNVISNFTIEESCKKRHTINKIFTFVVWNLIRGNHQPDISQVTLIKCQREKFSAAKAVRLQKQVTNERSFIKLKTGHLIELIFLNLS